MSHYTLNEMDLPYPFLNKNFLFVDAPEIARYLAYVKNTNLTSVGVPDSLLHDIGIGSNPYTSVFPRFELESYYCRVSPGLMTRANPNFTTIPIHNFFDLTDRRSQELKEFSNRYETIYLFWSGGIDSTMILCSLIKNWLKADLQKIIVVCSAASIVENPTMYDSYIRGNFNCLDTNMFVDGTVQFTNNSIYVDGSCANSLYTYNSIYLYNEMFPDTYMVPWHTNEKRILQFFSKGTKITADTVRKHKRIVESMKKFGIEVESTFDYFWWISFSLGSNPVLFEIMTSIAQNFNPAIDVKKFFNENYFAWFDWKDYLEWSISAIGTNQKINGPITSLKYVSKKYIFDVNRDTEYFENKRMIASMPLTTGTPTGGKVLIGVDIDYNCYYVPSTYILNKSIKL